MVDFKNISYLKNGSAAQKRVYDILTATDILGELAAYDPIVAGTFPLDIQIDGSDVDIICQYQDEAAFIDTLHRCFAGFNNFIYTKVRHTNPAAVLASFDVEGLSFEIFGQIISTEQQNAYRHMVIEHCILMQRGPDFKQKVIELKKQGFKTEPAFCMLLGLTGNPYEALLDFTVDC